MRSFHFEVFVPNLGDNHKLPADQQLRLLLATGVTKKDLRIFEKAGQVKVSPQEIIAGAIERVDEKITKADDAEAALEEFHDKLLEATYDLQAAGLAKVWADYVKLERGGHTIDGRAVGTLEQYLQVIVRQNGLFNFVEIGKAFRQYNSAEGAFRLFSNALSGGSTGTDSQSSANNDKTSH